MAMQAREADAQEVEEGPTLVQKLEVKSVYRRRC